MKVLQFLKSTQYIHRNAERGFPNSHPLSYVVLFGTSRRDATFIK